ncbi:hypothetical protein C0J52_07530 [Blattella germanica]|nr:hypothetical protein C0J52_07530 [Blattella germanica]
MNGNRCFWALNKTINSKCARRKAKIWRFRTIIKPTVVASMEVKPERAIKLLNVWENKIFGPTCKQEILIIVTEIKLRRLGWLEHINRMQSNCTPKALLDAMLVGRRKVGRPKLRWQDHVQADLTKAGIKIWRLRALDRRDWSAVLRKSTAGL